MSRSRQACYWCGAPKESREHIPPKSIFPIAKRGNLITVPSCSKHNNDFKLLDERMRFYVQAMCESQEALGEFDATTLRSLEDKTGAGLIKRLFAGTKLLKFPQVELPLLRFPPEDYVPYFEKITRGLHYHHKKKQFQGEFFIRFRQSFVVHKGTPEAFNLIGAHFNNPYLAKEPQVSNPDIFQYKYVDQTSESGVVFAVMMRFYKDLEVMGVLSRMAHSG